MNLLRAAPIKCASLFLVLLAMASSAVDNDGFAVAALSVSEGELKQFEDGICFLSLVSKANPVSDDPLENTPLFLIDFATNKPWPSVSQTVVLGTYTVMLTVHRHGAVYSARIPVKTIEVGKSGIQEVIDLPPMHRIDVEVAMDKASDLQDEWLLNVKSPETDYLARIPLRVRNGKLIGSWDEAVQGNFDFALLSGTGRTRILGKQKIGVAEVLNRRIQVKVSPEK